MMQQGPIERDLVLLGGGHTHAIVLRMWAMNPIPGVRITLVSDSALTPYSGMLPGLVAGHYTLSESYIDLVRLCKWAGVRFIEARADSVDVSRNRVQFSLRPEISYDFLSIDTGGAPQLDQVEGAEEFTIPVKPVSQFFQKWKEIERRIQHSDHSLDIAVVGAGAGGFEILMAMHFRVEKLSGDSTKHRFHWVIRDQILADYPKGVQRKVINVCNQSEINCHRNFNVSRVEKNLLISEDNTRLKFDELLWCTEARASEWPSRSGLQCTSDGYIAISDTLQSCSHANVFAAGDVAVQLNHPRPRAGVFAVRQGPPLFQNLRRVLTNKSLKEYRPQKRFLTILSMGDKTAIANKGLFYAAGGWVWRWKDHIDQRFMNRFNKLPPMSKDQKSGSLQNKGTPKDLDANFADMRCGGCGGKIGSDILSHVIADIQPVDRDDQLTGIKEATDVAVIDPGSRLLAQSVDQIKAMIDDPWIFARIATIHALSDLFAAGAEPQSAMAMVGLPYAAENITKRELEQIMLGIVHELNAAGCVLSGGHTSESDSLTVGMVVNGYVAADGKVPMVGQSIILTKPLGVGVVLAGHMRAQARGEDVSKTVSVMLKSNDLSASILRKNGVTAMTDVTGFGLAGHLMRLLEKFDVSGEIELDNIPVVSGSTTLSQQGIQSSLFPANKQVLAFCAVESGVDQHPAFALLFDPQTSGGLVASVPTNLAQTCVNQLSAEGYDAAVIGSIVSGSKHKLKVVICHD